MGGHMGEEETSGSELGAPSLSGLYLLSSSTREGKTALKKVPQCQEQSFSC